MSTAIGPYTPIVAVGERWLVCSGQGGIIDGVPVEGGLGAEVRQTMANIATLLASEGATLSDVVKATVFLVDMADYDEMNGIYADAFGEHRPARTTVAVAALPLGLRVEIEVWARRPAPSLDEAPASSESEPTEQPKKAKKAKKAKKG